MSKRTLTVDTKALYGTVRLLCIGALLVAVWFAWVPIQALFADDAKKANVTEGNTEESEGMDDAERDMAIERLLKGADEASGRLHSFVFHYVPESGRFVSIDLVGREVTLYENGSRKAALPIVRVPESGAPNALTDGDFAVDSKKELEVSTLTMVRFPHAVHFGRGFALHGAPTDERGAMLATSSAEGSVELADDSAKTLYDFVATGTPLHVRVGAETPPYAPYTALVANTKVLPATSAHAFAVADLARGQVVLEKNAGKTRPIASITKLFTVCTASNTLGHGTDVRAPSGEYYTLGDLFYPLLLRSDNDVANAIAEHVGVRTFVGDMNAYVRALGMPSTSFADSSGLSPHNVSSASDLVVFARHLYLNKRYVLDVSKEDAMTITSKAGATWSVTNQNKLASDPHFVGGKLGFTDEAGQTALSIFEVPIDGETRTIAVVVLGSGDWKQDTRTLLRWLLQNVKVER